MLKKMQTLRMLHLQEALGLDDATTLQMHNYLKQQDEARFNLMTRKGEIADLIHEGLSAGTLTDADAALLLADDMQVEKDLFDNEEQTINGLASILTPTQQLKYSIAVRDFERQVREAVHDARREERRGERRGDHPGGGPPR